MASIFVIDQKFDNHPCRSHPVRWMRSETDTNEIAAVYIYVSPAHLPLGYEAHSDFIAAEATYRKEALSRSQVAPG